MKEFLSSRWNRREALHLRSAGVAGLMTGCGADSSPGTTESASASDGNTEDMAPPIIRTLLGDISPNEIDGVTLFHEHLSIKLSEKE